MKVAKDILSTTSLSYLTLIANYIFATIVIRYSGSSYYADYILITTLIAIAFTTVSAGLPLSLVRYEGDGFKNLADQYIKLISIVSIISFCFVLFLNDGLKTNSITFTFLLLGLFTAILSLMMPIFQWKNKFVSLQKFTFIYALAKALIITGFFVYINKYVDDSSSLTLVVLIFSLLYLIYINKKEQLFNPSSSLIKLNFQSLYKHKNNALWASTLSVIIYSKVDILMLPLFSISKNDIGNYAYIYGFFSAVLLLPAVIQNLLMRPLSQNTMDGNKVLKTAFKTYIPSSFIIFFAFIFILPPVIKFLINVDLTRVIISMAPAIPIIFVANLLGLSLLTLKHDKERTRAQLSAAATNIVLNIFLIPKFGILGAAYATTTSYFVLYILFLLDCFKHNVWNIRNHKLMLIGLSLLFLLILLFCFY